MSGSPKVVAIVQARMGSTRLPGKVMLRLGTDTVLSHVVKRIRLCARIDETIIATTELPEDDIIAREAARIGAPIFRGSAEDVLARYRGAAEAVRAEIVIRVTSDCPLLDGALLCAMLADFLAQPEGSCDYLTNSLKRTYPRGLDVEIFTRAALEEAFVHARERYEREHVTPYIYEHPERFRLRHYLGREDLSDLRWTLDTREDYAFLAEIFSRLDRGGPPFSTSEVLSLLRAEPQLIELNRHVTQKGLKD